jgi:DNA helicase IV
MRENLGNARQAAANKGAAARLGHAAKTYAGRLGGPDEPVAYGRFDHDGEIFYVGMHGIFDNERELLVIDWRTDHGALYERATAADPVGVTVERAFRTDRNTILDFDDLVFAHLVDRLAELSELEQSGVTDVLLDDLHQTRTGAMRDIVKTIQAAQSGLIRHPLESLFGGAGWSGHGQVRSGLAPSVVAALQLLTDYST